MIILAIAVEILKFLKKNVNENIQCDHGYEYSSGKQKKGTWVNEEIWEMTKNCLFSLTFFQKIHNLYRYSEDTHQNQYTLDQNILSMEKFLCVD